MSVNLQHEKYNVLYSFEPAFVCVIPSFFLIFCKYRVEFMLTHKDASQGPNGGPCHHL